MTLAQFQAQLHLMYQGDTDTPSTSDDEWTLRTGYLKMAINAWDSEKGTVWAELWTNLADAATGDKTVIASDLDYDCPTDFRFPGGFVRITTGSQHEYVSVLPMQKAELYKNTTEKACYFTGNLKTGYDLHFLYQPTAGYTINYPYYKTAFEPSSSSDVIEMSDPYFAIEYALSKMHESDGDGDRATLAMAKAVAKLESMKNRNTLPAWYQEHSIPDRDFNFGSTGFGN